MVACVLQNGSAVDLLQALLSANTHRLCFRAQHCQTAGVAKLTIFRSNYKITEIVAPENL